MCGIVAIVRRPSTRPVPGAAAIVGMVESAATILFDGAATAATRLGDLAHQLEPAAEGLHAAKQLLSGVPGLRLLLESPEVSDTLRELIGGATASVAALETRLDADPSLDPAELEHINEQLVRVRDGLWALGRDRLGAASAVSKLAPGTLVLACATISRERSVPVTAAPRSTAAALALPVPQARSSTRRPACTCAASSSGSTACAVMRPNVSW